MSGTVKIAATISKEAFKLVKAGEAFLSSGGVRRMGGGQIIEMFRPVAKSTLNAGLSGAGLGPVGAAVNIASSLTNNVQSAFIQHGVNVANMKLDVVIDKLSALTNAMQGLQQVQVLSWVTSAFSLANCGISVAGFHMVLSRLKGMEGVLYQFHEEYRQDKQDERVGKFGRIMADLEDHLVFLKERYRNDSYTKQDFKHREAMIVSALNEAQEHLGSILNALKTQRIDGQTGCQIVFGLMPVYAQVVNEFCCQYFYCHGIKHTLFEKWISILDEIESPAFREYLRRFFTFDANYLAIPRAKKMAAEQLLLEAVEQQKSRLLLCSEAVLQIPEEQYIMLDEILNQKCLENLAVELPEIQNENLDDVLMLRIENDMYEEMDNGMIMIPLSV